MEHAMHSDKLAIHGGTPARAQPAPAMLPGILAYDVAEEEAVLEVLRSRNLYRFMDEAEPSQCDRLEALVRQEMGCRYALAVTSGTSALVCALQGLDVGPGDEVIVPAFGWIASVSAVLGVGAVPVITEVDASLTLDPEAVQANISAYTKAIMPVHMRGAPANLEALLRIAREQGLKVVEDTAQANGGAYRGRYLGTYGHAGAFSLQASKIVTSGEGGLVITDEEEVFTRAAMFHDPFSARLVDVPESRVMWGLNFRMSEVTAAMARVQIAKRARIIDAMRARKRLIKDGIASLAAAKGVQFRRLHDAAGDTAVALILFMPDTDATARVEAALQAENVSAQRLFAPGRVDQHVYASWSSVLAKAQWSAQGGPWTWARRDVAYDADMCPRTLDWLQRSIQIHIQPTLTNEDAEETLEGLAKVLTHLL